jgi:outer membrane immunogenic protein
MDKRQTTRKLLLASVSPFALAVVGSASAADLPFKAPSAAISPSPVYSWTGCYVGAHVGYGWGRQDLTHASTSTSIPTGSGGSGGGGPTITHAAGSGTIDSHGGVFGGQVGCNYQFASNWVFGVEAMIAGTDIKGSMIDPLDATNTISVKTPWMTSAVARLGFTAWNNQALFYVKGGVAGDRNEWTQTNGNNFNEDRLGWTIGGGVEWAFAPKWSTFLDFSYYDFGNGTTFSSTSGVNPFVVDTISTGKQRIETVKIGVNYKFIGP